MSGDEAFIARCWMWLSENAAGHRSNDEVVALMRRDLANVTPSPNGMAEALIAEDEAWDEGGA